MTARTDWDEFNRNTPEAFWDVAIWPHDGNGHMDGSLDVAGRKRIFEAARAYQRPDKGDPEHQAPRIGTEKYRGKG